MNVACAIGQCSYLGKTTSPALSTKLKLAAYGLADLLRQAVGMSPLYIPVVAQPGQISALPGEDAVVGMNKLAEDKKYVYPHLFTSTCSDLV